MDSLIKRLSQAATKEEKLALLAAKAVTFGPSIQTGPPRIMTTGQRDYMKDFILDGRDPNDMELVYALAKKYDLEAELVSEVSAKLLSGILPEEDSWTGPIKFVPCANVYPEIHEKCPNVGTRACANCRLALYCSTTCQKFHWKRHKQDCKHHFNSKEWVPAWIREGRKPIFSMPASSRFPFDLRSGHGAVGMGGSLWGNVPAIDLLNLKNNEGLGYTDDLSLVFAASGDLRNVLYTINNIPTDYSGKVSVVINDMQSQVVIRNFLILLVLLEVKDISLAADIALHLWYSAFLPAEYETRIFHAAYKYLERLGKDPNKLQSAVVQMDFSDGARAQLKTYMEQIEKKAPEIDVASIELLGVMSAPHRVDYHDRYHCTLKPAHRIAMRDYRSSGLVLPFGAANAHFNTANKTLFTAKGRWIQDDMLYPTSGWDLTQVIAAGRSHGATSEDLFGCLYFHLTDQLHKLKEQLLTLNVQLHLMDFDCRDLAAFLKSPEAKPSSSKPIIYGSLPTKFDRIDVSNTVDDTYVGFQQILSDWSGLLNRQNSNSTLLAYSMNWVWKEPKAEPDEDEEAISRITSQLFREKRFDHIPGAHLLSVWSPAVMIMKAASPAMYDNSKIFTEYLRKRRVVDIASGLGIQIKKTHTIVPKRHGIPLGAPLSSLPTFSSDDEWYQEVCLSRRSFFTRFIEFSLSEA